MSALRRVEILEDDQWKEIQFKELKEGNTFRMFEPDGEPVVDDRDEFEGAVQWLVTGHPYLNDSSVWEVQCDLTKEDAEKRVGNLDTV